MSQTRPSKDETDEKGTSSSETNSMLEPSSAFEQLSDFNVRLEAAFKPRIIVLRSIYESVTYSPTEPVDLHQIMADNVTAYNTLTVPQAENVILSGAKINNVIKEFRSTNINKKVTICGFKMTVKTKVGPTELTMSRINAIMHYKIGTEGTGSFKSPLIHGLVVSPLWPADFAYWIPFVGAGFNFIPLLKGKSPQDKRRNYYYYIWAFVLDYCSYCNVLCKSKNHRKALSFAEFVQQDPNSNLDAVDACARNKQRNYTISYFKDYVQNEELELVIPNIVFQKTSVDTLAKNFINLLLGK